MVYIAQNAEYGVDIPGSVDIVSGLYPSYASVTQNGGGKGGYTYQSPVSGKTTYIPDNLSDRRKGRREMRFDKQERKRLDKEERKRLRRESRLSIQKARSFMKSLLSQSKRPEDNVGEEINGGGKKRGSSKRKKRRVSTVRKNRGRSRGSFKKRKYSKTTVVQSIMKGIDDKRKSHMRRYSMKRGGMGATCAKYIASNNMPDSNLDSDLRIEYNHIKNITKNTTRWRGLNDFMVFEVEIIYNDKSLRIEMSVGDTKKLRRELLKIVPGNSHIEDLRNINIKRIVVNRGEKECYKLFNNIELFYHKLNNIIKIYRNTRLAEKIIRILIKMKKLQEK